MQIRVNSYIIAKEKYLRTVTSPCLTNTPQGITLYSLLTTHYSLLTTH